MYPMPTRPPSVATIREPANIQRNIVSHEGPAHAEIPLPRAPGGPGPCGMPCGAMHDGSHVHHFFALIPGWSMECRPQRPFQSQAVPLFLV